MKKIITIGVLTILTFSLTGCSEKKPNNENNSIPTSNPTESPNEDAPIVEKEKTFNIPGQKVYFSHPSDWSNTDRVSTTAIFKSTDCLVGVSYDWVTEFDGTLEEIIDLFSESFAWDVASLCKGYIAASSIEVLNTERTTIAGRESVRFTGFIKNNSWNSHVYGYTYQINGINIMVTCLVSAQEQDPAMIAKINALTDQIAASVHTEE